MKKYNIEDMNKLAVSRNGKCLSKKYINTRIKLKWKCHKGHTWTSPHNSISSGRWCPDCGGRKKGTIKNMQEIAKARKGKCLSDKYINSWSKLKWECKNKHIFNMIPRSIKEGHWCSACLGLKKGNLLKMKKIAKLMGGKCISKRYVNNNTKLKWKCKNNHIWLTRPRNICSGYWCPKCCSLKSENMCKKHIEDKTHSKFIKCNPDWLNHLELDGYCKKLNLAFEYNGIQHYKIDGYFRQTEKELKDQQKRDKLKRRLCKLNKVKIITIPYKYNCYKPKEMYKFIDSKLNKIINNE